MFKTFKLISLFFIFLFLASSAQAKSCKVEVSTADNFFSSAPTGRPKKETINRSSTKKVDIKHMRKIKNNGDFDIRIEYWSGTFNENKVIKKGRTENVSGDLKAIECLNTPSYSTPNRSHAKECKLRVGYASNFYSNTIIGKKPIILNANSTKNYDLKHMRMVKNQGDFDATVEYWDGGSANNKKNIKKGERVMVSGDLKKVQCLKLVKGKDTHGEKVCRLDAKFASAPLTPFHSIEKIYTLKRGETITKPKKYLRKIENIGSFDTEIEIRLGEFDIGTKRINVGDNFIGQVDFVSVRCLGSDSPKLSIADKFIEDLNNAKKSTDTVVKEAADLFEAGLKGGQLKSPPRDCKFDKRNIINASNYYKNRYKGSYNKFKNLTLNSTFSDINNYLMMQASGKTYFEEIRYKNRSAVNKHEFMCGAQELYRHWGFDRIQFIDTKDSVNVIIASNKESVVIAIRGTQGFAPITYGESIKTIIDLAVNANKVLIPASFFSMRSKGSAHFGYSLAASNLLPFVEKALNNVQARNKKIFVTGHSLGAATAIMLSAFLETRSKYNVTATYAFAPPEVGNERFTRDLHKLTPIYMTVNYRDPIPNVGRKPYKGSIKNKLASALYGSRKTTFFTKNHTTKIFSSRYPSVTRKKDISRIQEAQPYAFFEQNSVSTPPPLSSEWSFHSANHYIAHTYSNLVRTNFTKKSGTELKPEFFKSKTCTLENGKASWKLPNWDGEATLKLFEKDRQGYPFTFSGCK